eukprot:367770_1
MSTEIHEYKRMSLTEYDGSILTPTSRLVYKQWKMDGNDDLIIDGYFRKKCNLKSYHLPNDIKQIITSYYQKKHSKSKLMQLIMQKQHSIERAKIRKEQKRKEMKHRSILIGFIVLTIFLFMLVTDICGLIFVANNNCNLEKNEQRNFDVNEFLIYGSIIHLAFVIFLQITLSLLIWHNKNEIYWNDCVYTSVLMLLCFVSLMYVFFAVWSIIGFVLYQKMNNSKELSKPCADMVISWSIIKIVEVVAAPFVIYKWIQQNINFPF